MEEGFKKASGNERRRSKVLRQPVSVEFRLRRDRKKDGTREA